MNIGSRLTIVVLVTLLPPPFTSPSAGCLSQLVLIGNQVSMRRISRRSGSHGHVSKVEDCMRMSGTPGAGRVTRTSFHKTNVRSDSMIDRVGCSDDAKEQLFSDSDLPTTFPSPQQMSTPADTWPSSRMKWRTNAHPTDTPTRAPHLTMQPTSHMPDHACNTSAASGTLQQASEASINKDPADRLLLASWGLPEEVLRCYHRMGITSMFPWQAECLSLSGVLEGRSLVYSAPTSAGKTLVAELLVLKRVLETRCKALLILPFVSVAREKMMTLQTLFQDAGIRVDGFIGSMSPAGGIASVDVAVCTIEKANSLINRLLEEGTMNTLGTVVVDELHMVGDAQRGYLLELLLTKVRFMATQPTRPHEQQESRSSLQIVGMSATLPNLDLLGRWLDAAIYSTDFRPVPLTEGMMVGTAIFDRNKKKVRDLVPYAGVHGDDDHVVSLCLETMSGGHSLVIFCPTKNWCEKLAFNIAKNFHNLNHSTPPDALPVVLLQKPLLRDVLEQLRRTPVGLDGMLAQLVPQGVAFHHAGLTFDERDILEGAFRSGSLRVLVATSTLSSGVNLPARRVLIRTPMFYGATLNTLVYKQMVGRAGRKGVDTEGESILLCKASETVRGSQLLTSSLDPVHSCLMKQGESLSSSLKRAILEVVVSGVAQTPADVERYASCTMLAVDRLPDNDSGPCGQELVELCINFLTESEFIILKKVKDAGGIQTEQYVASQLGRAVLSSALSPDEGLVVFAELQRARSCFVLENELHILYQVTPIYQVWTNIDWYHFLCLWEALPPGMRRVAECVGVSEAFLARMVQGRSFPSSSSSSVMAARQRKIAIHRRFYTSLVLLDLVNEMPLPRVAEKYKCTRGVLQSLQQSAATFAGMVTVFCSQLGWTNLELLLGQYQPRLNAGVQRELVDLVRIELLNAHRARALFDAGLLTVAAVANATVDQVESLLRKAVPFQSMKQTEDESEWEMRERQRTRCIWVTGKQGLSERDAAVVIIDEARRLVEQDLGVQGVQWKPHNSTSNAGPDKKATRSQVTQVKTQCDASATAPLVAGTISGKVDKSEKTTVSNDALSFKISKPLMVNGTTTRESHSGRSGQTKGTANDHKQKLVPSNICGMSTPGPHLERSGPNRKSGNSSPCKLVQGKVSEITTSGPHMERPGCSRDSGPRQSLPPVVNGMTTDQFSHEELHHCAHTRNSGPPQPTASLVRVSHTPEPNRGGPGCDAPTPHGRPHNSLLFRGKAPLEHRSERSGHNNNGDMVKNGLHKSVVNGSGHGGDKRDSGLHKPVSLVVNSTITAGPHAKSSGRSGDMVKKGEEKPAPLKISNTKESGLEKPCRESRAPLLEVPGNQEQDPTTACHIDVEEEKSREKTAGNPPKVKLFSNLSDSSFEVDQADSSASLHLTVPSTPEPEQKNKSADQDDLLYISYADRNSKTATTPTHASSSRALQMTDPAVSTTVDQEEDMFNDSFMLDTQLVNLISESATSSKKDTVLTNKRGNFVSPLGKDTAYKDDQKSSRNHTVHKGSPEKRDKQEESRGGDSREGLELLLELSHDADLEVFMDQYSTQAEAGITSSRAAPEEDLSRQTFSGPRHANSTDENGLHGMDRSWSGELEPLSCSANRGMLVGSFTDSPSVEQELVDASLVGVLPSTAHIPTDLSPWQPKHVVSCAAPSRRESSSPRHVTQTEETAYLNLQQDSTILQELQESFVADEVGETDKAAVADPEALDPEQDLTHFFEENFGTFEAAFEDTWILSKRSSLSPAGQRARHQSPDLLRNNKKEGIIEGSTVHVSANQNSTHKPIGALKNQEGLQPKRTIEGSPMGATPRKMRKMDKSNDSIAGEDSQINTSDCVPPTPPGISLHNFSSHRSPASTRKNDLNQSLPLTHENFTIVDVASDRRLFNHFLEEWRTKSNYALCLACEKVAGTGASTRGKPHGMPVEGTDLELHGVAICWGNRDAFYLSLTDTQDDKEDPEDSLAAPPLDPLLPVSDRLAALNQQLMSTRSRSRHATGGGATLVFDARAQYKVYTLATSRILATNLQDPKVALWLLDPGSKEQSLHREVHNRLPLEVHLLEGLGGGIGVGSLGLNPENPGSGRLRSCVEAVLVLALSRHLEAELGEAGLAETFSQVEMPVQVLLACMEMNGFGFSDTECSRQRALLEARLAALEEEAYHLAGHPFSLSSPEDVAQVLFIELRLPPSGDPTNPTAGCKTLGPARRGSRGGSRGRSRGGRTGFSTSKEVLERLRPLHSLPSVVLEWRRLTAGLAKVVCALDREKVHSKKLGMYRIHGLCQTHTATGRVSMAEPNLQNVPKDFDIDPATSGGPVSMRQAFIPFPGGIMVAADYSQLELRIIAHLSRDQRLISILNAGQDVFKMIAAQWRGVELEVVTTEERQQAKQICYGMLYGIGAKALGEQLGVSEQEAGVFMETFKDKYIGLRSYLRECVAQCRKLGYTQTMFGRRRQLPAINDTNPHARAHAERQAVNTTVQGSAADLVKKAMVAVDKRLSATFKSQNPSHRHNSSSRSRGSRYHPSGAFLLLQLHDELIYETMADSLHTVARILKEEMESAVSLSVRMPVKVKAGQSWGELSDLEL